MSTAVMRYGRFTGAGLDADRLAGTVVLATLIAIPMAGTLAALGFLMSGLGLLAWRPGESLRAAWRFWPILSLPIFCTASILWSEAPAATLRFGLQLTFTMLVGLVLATRMSLRHFLITVFFVLSAVVALSIVAGNYRTDTGALRGFYASKNAMGGAAAILALIGLGLARTGTPGFRLIALGASAIAALAVFLSQSVSALLALMMALSAVIALRLLRPLRPLVRSVCAVFLTLFAALVMILAAAHFEAISAAILALTGKDVTLTGRTDLWRVAVEEIARYPLLGQGYQSFWLPGNPTAELLWETFGIEGKTGFHFHNTYLSNAVEIGILGAAIQTMIILAAVYAGARLALADAEPAHDILFGLLAMIFVLTPVEVPVFFQFNVTTLILVAAFVYARDGLRAAKASGPRGSPRP